MQVFRGVAKRRALNKLARELPRRLRTDYGASEYFTPGQIRTALSKIDVAPAFFVFGYAMFLPEAAFEALRPQQDGPLSYREARAEVLRHVPGRQPDSDRPYDFNVDWSNASAGWSLPDAGHGDNGGQ